jgi:hypothetical protein
MLVINANQFRIVAGNTERFSVGSDVNVQGATDLNICGPSRRLSFTSGTGTIRTTTSNKLFLQTNLTSSITIDAEQKVGIGTISPDATLELSPSGTSLSGSTQHQKH